MSAPIEFLAAHGGALLAGSSAVLGAGALARAASRAPIHRQRLAELALAAALCCVVLAVLPLPRFSSAAKAEPAIIAAPSEPMELVEPMPELAHAPLPQSIAPVSPHVALAPLPPSTVDAPTESALALSWPEWLALVYIAGFASAAAYLLLGIGLLMRLLRRAEPAPEWLDDLARRLSDGVLARAPRLLVTARSCRPFCTGLRRPTIVLPADLCQRQLAAPLRHVLEHEIAHLRQRDSRGHTLFAAALPLFWFHPLYWWLRVRAHLAAEMVADDLAARQSDGHSYVRSLIQFCERSTGRPVLGAVSVLRTSSEFYRRMNMLLEREGRLSTECSRLRRGVQGSMACALVAVATGLWGVPRLAAQEPDASVRHLQVEREELRAEVQSLRHELTRLRKTLEAKERAAEEPETTSSVAAPSGIGALGGVAGPAGGLSIATPAQPSTGVSSVAGVATSPAAQGGGDVAPGWRDLATTELRALSVPSVQGVGGAVSHLGGHAMTIATPAQPGTRVSGVAGVATAPSPSLTLPSTAITVETPSLTLDPVAVTLPAPVASVVAPSTVAIEPVVATTEPSDPLAAPVARPNAAATPRAAAAGRDLNDVIDLVTRAIDLEGELELSKSELATATKQAEAAAISKHELRAAEVKYRTTERKLHAVHAALAAERTATELELHALMQRPKDADTDSRSVRLEARLEVLGSIK